MFITKKKTIKTLSFIIQKRLVMFFCCSTIIIRILILNNRFIYQDLVPKNATYYGNRSAAYLALSKHKDAVDDARMATSLDENYIKVKLYRAF